MKKIALGLLVGWMAFSAVNALAAEEQWLTDLPKATAAAKKEKKLVLLDFTGSDWCPPCKALHKNVLTSKEFNEFAKANLVLVELDFPRTKTQSAELKKANAALSDKHKITGYPTIIVLDTEGKELFKQVGYGGTSAEDYVGKLKKAVKK